MIKEFFLELDSKLEIKLKRPIILPIIGSAAIFLQHPYQRGTKDSDVLEIEEIPEKETLLKLAGKGTKLARRHSVYLEIVARGFPFLPAKANFHSLNLLNAKLQNFEIQALDVVDVVVSKLKPFRAQDREDIKAVIKLGLVDPKKLVERFKLAKDRWLTDARAKDLLYYVDNLHHIQREYLDVPESDIDIPRYVLES